MKRTWTITLLCCLLILAGGITAVLLPRTPSPDQYSSQYRQYLGQEGIKASFVCDYQVDDTTFVDVTLLHATTDSAWVSLCMESLPDVYSEDDKKEIVTRDNYVSTWIAAKNDLHTNIIPSDSVDFNLVLLAATMKTIYIFHPQNPEQASVVYDTLVPYIIHSNSKNKPLK